MPPFKSSYKYGGEKNFPGQKVRTIQAKAINIPSEKSFVLKGTTQFHISVHCSEVIINFNLISTPFKTKQYKIWTFSRYYIILLIPS